MGQSGGAAATAASWLAAAAAATWACWAVRAPGLPWALGPAAVTNAAVKSERCCGQRRKADAHTGSMHSVTSTKLAGAAPGHLTVTTLSPASVGTSTRLP